MSIKNFFTKRSKPEVESTFIDRATYPEFSITLSYERQSPEKREALREAYYDFMHAVAALEDKKVTEGEYPEVDLTPLERATAKWREGGSH